MRDIYYHSSNKKTTIHAVVWEPQGEPKGVVQIVHGMAEYAARYNAFASYLIKQGFVVCGEDHLGHGLSVESKDDLGFFGKGKSANLVLSDIRSLHLKMNDLYPDLPYFLLGHSMGSFFSRVYASEYGDELSGLIVVGSGMQPFLATHSGKIMCRVIAAFKGWKHRSKTIDKIAFGTYNSKITDAKTPFDWLSADDKNVNAYLADELCGFMFTCGGFYGLFEIIERACRFKTFSKTPKRLPVFVLSGIDDPVGDYGSGVKRIAENYRRAGVRSVELTLYDGGRHEILNDFCAEQVYEEVLQFINARV